MTQAVRPSIEGHADLVLHGAAGFTGLARWPGPMSVAVREGRIQAVGGEDVLDLVGPRTEVVDLRGRMLLPGFVDAHIHAVWGAVEAGRCALADLSGLDEYLAALDRYARSHPDIGWIKGGGWRMSDVPPEGPRAADLDAVVSDRPVFLWSKDAHQGWANSRALVLAGIGSSTADPPGGRIGRLADGEPSGALYERAIDLVTAVMPREAHADLVDAVYRAQRELHALGIVAWQDAIVARNHDEGDPADAYLEVERAGGLTARVIGALWWDRTVGREQIDQLVERRARYSSGRLRCSTVKIMQDGIVEARSASVLVPYLDPELPEGQRHGTSFVSSDLLVDALVALDAEDFDVHLHTIGDRAVREALDAIAAARAANGPRDARHQLAHVQLVDPADLQRFAELGVIANIQPYWATRQKLMVEHTMPLLGAPRNTRQYPFGDLWRAGAVLAAGSDWPVSTPDPLTGIHVAVNRMMVPGHRGEGAPPFFPEQALPLEVALRAYTSGAAQALHLGDLGRIEAGVPADLVVLDRDLFETPSDELGLARVEATFVDGVRVYSA